MQSDLEALKFHPIIYPFSILQQQSVDHLRWHGIDEVQLAVPVAARGVVTKEPVLPLHCISVPLATALSFNGQPPASTIYEPQDLELILIRY